MTFDIWDMRIDGDRKQQAEHVLPGHVICRYFLLLSCLGCWLARAKSVGGSYEIRGGEDGASRKVLDGNAYVHNSEGITSVGSKTILDHVTLGDNKGDSPDVENLANAGKRRNAISKNRKVGQTELDSVFRSRVENNRRQLLTLDADGKITLSYLTNSTNVRTKDRFLLCNIIFVC